MQWFRLYDDLVFNAKAQSLPPRLFKHWINLLCLASKNKPRGTLPSVERIAFALRMHPSRVSVVLQSLFKRGFMSSLCEIYDWSSYQFQSDDSALRKRVQRNKEIGENVTGQSRDSHAPRYRYRTDTDTDTEQKGKGNRPAAEKRAGDAAADMFKKSYGDHIGNPYEWQDGDFVQLARLRKRLKLNPGTSPEDWESALVNYFASPFPEYSLRHFSSKFDTFKNSSLDRYHVPVHHRNGGSNGTKADRTQKATESALRRLDQQDSERGER
jgi:hypothetical protein